MSWPANVESRTLNVVGLSDATRVAVPIVDRGLPSALSAAEAKMLRSLV